MANDRLIQACCLSQDDWVASMPAEMAHSFHAEYHHHMEKLYGKMCGNRYHHLTKASFSLLVAAVLIIALMVASVAYEPVRNYFLRVYPDHTEFLSETEINGPIEMDMAFGYIPEGFVLSEREIDGETCPLNKHGEKGEVSYYRFEKEALWIDVSKTSAGGWMGVDSEDYSIELLQHDGQIYFISHSDSNYYGVYWIRRGIAYGVRGPVPRNQIIKMAYSME